MIMLVTDGDRALLGRQSVWPAGRYSALAGFVEPGERLEAAVAREVREEAGVEVRDVRYIAVAAVAVPDLADARLRGDLRERRADDRATPSSRTSAGLTARSWPPPPATTWRGSTDPTPSA